METDKNILPPNITNPTESVFVIKNTFSDHSNEIEEIISKKPPFIVRWGTVFFFFLLLLIGMICWLIQYPDIVTAKAKLTSLNAPKTIVSKIDGKLIKLTTKEDDIVPAGTVIGFMESTSNAEEVLTLSADIDTLSALFSNSNGAIPPKFFIQPYKNLGELQQAYQTFSHAFIDFKNYLHGGFYEKRNKYSGMIYQT